MLSPRKLHEMMKPNDLAVLAVLADVGSGEMKYAGRVTPLIIGKDNPESTPGHILRYREARAVIEQIASEARAQDQAIKSEGKALAH